MAELSTADVEAYTEGRLGDDGADSEVGRMLSAALTVARLECRWHVSPVKTETLTLDGPDSRILWLPTMKVVGLTSVEEDGTALDVSSIAVSVGDGALLRRRTALRKRNRGWWTDQYGGVEVAMSHGFTEAEAADWRQAVLSMVDQMSEIPVKASTGVSSFGQSSLRVDDVQIGYSNPYIAMAEEVVFSIGHILCNYKLPPVEFI